MLRVTSLFAIVLMLSTSIAQATCERATKDLERFLGYFSSSGVMSSPIDMAMLTLSKGDLSSDCRNSISEIVERSSFDEIPLVANSFQRIISLGYTLDHIGLPEFHNYWQDRIARDLNTDDVLQLEEYIYAISPKYREKVERRLSISIGVQRNTSFPVVELMRKAIQLGSYRVHGAVLTDNWGFVNEVGAELSTSQKIRLTEDLVLGIESRLPTKQNQESNVSGIVYQKNGPDPKVLRKTLSSKLLLLASLSDAFFSFRGNDDPSWERIDKATEYRRKGFVADPTSMGAMNRRDAIYFELRRPNSINHELVSALLFNALINGAAVTLVNDNPAFSDLDHFSLKTILELQKLLSTAGFYKGPIDGIMYQEVIDSAWAASECSGRGRRQFTEFEAPESLSGFFQQLVEEKKFKDETRGCNLDARPFILSQWPEG